MTNHETPARDALMQAHVALAAQAGRDQADLARLRAVVARLTQMTDHWERQLPEVIRTPAVVSAIRTALEPAVSVPPPAPRADVEAIARVRALHVPDENGNCRDCQASFDPCPTIVAIDGDRTSFGPGEGVYGRDPFYEADVPGPVAGEQQNETPEAVRCGCEWMPKRAAKGA